MRQGDLRHGRIGSWLACLILLALAVTTAGPAAAKGGLEAYTPGEVLVKFKADLEASARDGLLRSLGMEAVKAFPRIGVLKLRIPKGESVPDAVDRLSADPTVLYAEPNYRQYALSTFPDDPMFGNQWALHNTGQTGGTPDADMDAPEAWDVTTGSTDVVVCVIDTGVVWSHEDLAANMWTNPVELGGTAGVDDDGNGYVDDIYGINAITGTGDPMDDNAHGTHCAGTVAAVGNNATGVSGVNWTARIMGCKFLNSGGSGGTDDAIECVEYATNMGANVMSNSWGGGGFSQSLQDAIADADSQGILFVAAAGNNSSNNDLSPNYPSNYETANVIAVAATDHDDALAGFSNYGAATVDVGAPGVDIFSTFLTGAYLTSGCNDADADGYGFCSGTSMACPNTAGLAALALAAHPGESHLEIKARILRTVDLVPGLAGKVLTGGRVNAHRALTDALVGPHIFGLLPAYGDVGDTVTLAGDGFGATQGTGYVTFHDGLTASITSWSDAEIVCEVPVGTETGDVTVTTDEGTSNAVTFTIVIPFYDEALVPHTYWGDGTAMGWQADDACWSYTLPFSFPYFDTDYGSVYVCSNGFLDFTSGYADYANSEEGLRARAMIAPLWDDLRTDGTGRDIHIHQPTAGTVAVRWEAVTYSGLYPVDVEVILGSDGIIQFNYGEGNTSVSPHHRHLQR